MLLSGWGVGDGVLIADVMRDLDRKRLDVVHVFWIERQTTRRVGQLVQSTPRFYSLMLLLFREETNGID